MVAARGKDRPPPVLSPGQAGTQGKAVLVGELFPSITQGKRRSWPGRCGNGSSTLGYETLEK